MSESTEVVTEEGKDNTEAEVKLNEAETEQVEADSAQSEEVSEESEDSQNSEQEDFKEKYYYLAAELENTRKRFDREKQNLLKFGNERVLSGLIEVVDNLERTVDAISADEDEKVKNIVVGIEMVKKQFLDVLSSNGLEQLQALGEIFDPNVHEAMAQKPCEGKKDQEVVEVFQKGYKLNGRLLRAAKVIVATENKE